MNLLLSLPPRRVNRIAVSCFFFLAGLCFSSWASRIPSIQQKLHLNNIALGGVLLALPCGLMVSLPLAGWLVHRFGSRPVAIGAALLYASILPLLGFAGAVWQLVTGLFFFGMAGNMLNISINTQAIGTEALYGRSVMASYHGLWSLAGFSGASIGGLFLSLGWRPWQHFLVITALAFIIVAIMAGHLITRDLAADENRPIFARPDRSLINLGIIAFCSMICEGTMFDWSNVYFHEVIHPPALLAGAGLTAFMSTMASGRFFGDWVTTRLGVKRILQISGSLTATGLLLSILFPWLLPALLGFLMVGAGVSSVVPLVYSAAGRSKILSPGVALAAVSTLGYLGFLFGPPFIGFIAHISSLRVSLGLIAILGSVIALFASKI
ncbi:MFS transporter [Puia dinghuensis]|uniref:MFS transporter n=1 Tax=Puia dinghuensis TaxID=1792502 RepID=A0A8J2U763_9BACT|nr:MFS transporter [Puia dinghuensis]GGA83157.1 MFS transporter [Puia dinghuensis]